MYRLLIVDDEEIITDSLHEVLTDQFPAKLDVYKAYSAKEALVLLNKIRIDIVLSDIKMPGMNGIELMGEIQKLWPKSKIMFLTGHSEFEYAYTAIQHKNVRYLLKTEGYSVVIDTIKAIILEIEQEIELSQLMQQSAAHALKSQLLEQESLLKLLLHDEYSHRVYHDDLQNKFELLNIPINANEPVIVVLSQVSLEDSYNWKNELVNTVSLYWDSYMANQFNYCLLRTKANEFMWFIQPNSKFSDTHEKQLINIIEGNLELVQEILHNNHHIKISFTMTERAVAWSNVHLTLDRLRSLQRFMLNEQLPLLQIDYEHFNQSENIDEQAKLTSKLAYVSSYIEIGKQEEIVYLLNEIEQSLIKKVFNIPMFTEVYYSIALPLFSYINKNKLNDRINDLNKLMKLDCHVSNYEAIAYLKGIVKEVFSLIRIDERNRATVTIDKICEYIHNHLGEDLSLIKLAEVHYFNPSYLSRFFKQEYGMNISEYIELCRINKSKILLENLEMKVRDVALQVGYEAAHSFTRFFKKATGMTPQDYREKFIQNK